MIRILLAVLLILLSTAMITSLKPATASQTSYDTTTLAGKLASVNNTPGLLISLSGYLQQEADVSDQATSSAAVASTNGAITPSYVLNSTLDGTTVKSPDVTVNQDSLAATQNEPTVAVDPNNPNRIVVGSNDYVTRTWSCMINGTPCSDLGDGYSGTYYSNDGGQTWCCIATDPQHLGTLIPGVERLAGGIYDAGGDSHLFFDNHGNVYFTGLGFDRTTPPNTVTLSKGTFDKSGNLHWGPPTFIGQTKSASTLNDKPWSAIDNNPASAFYGRIYVSWTRFIFNPSNGAYKQSPIIFAYSTDGGKTFSTPQLIAGNVLYSQGSHVMVGPDGTVYVSSYAADVVSPWQTCAQPASPTAVGRINCLALGNYVNNARLDYVVTNLTTSKTQTVTTHPINSRYQFGGGFIGDYTDLAVDSNNNFHAVWADTDNQQTVVWWYGFQFVPTKVHQQDIVTATGSF